MARPNKRVRRNRKARKRRERAYRAVLIGVRPSASLGHGDIGLAMIARKRVREDSLASRPWWIASAIKASLELTRLEQGFASGQFHRGPSAKALVLEWTAFLKSAPPYKTVRDIRRKHGILR